MKIYNVKKVKTEMTCAPPKTYRNQTNLLDSFPRMCNCNKHIIYNTVSVTDILDHVHTGGVDSENELESIDEDSRVQSEHGLQFSSWRLIWQCRPAGEVFHPSSGTQSEASPCSQMLAF